MTEPTPPGDDNLHRLMPASIRRKMERGEIVASGPIPLGETREDVAERRATALAARLRMYHVPGEFREAAYADLTPEQNPEGKVSRWWAEGGRTLMVLSETKGNGKSHTAYAVGNEVVRDPGIWTAAWNVADLNEAIRPDGDPTALDVARECTLLILDDLGGERMTDWTLGELTKIVDTRWREGRRTVVTTNLTAEELFDRYGDRILDRLRDEITVVQVTGPSRRGKRRSLTG